MEPALRQSSTYATWQKWAKILVRSLGLIAEIYDAHDEGAEAEKLRGYLERVRLFIDPLKQAQELAKRNYDVQGNVTKLYILATASLEVLFREALGFLPKISEDMQRLLNAASTHNTNGRTASDVFRGPHGSENEGLGSGIPDERGGLPWKLFTLVEQAETQGPAYFEKGLGNLAPSSQPQDADGQPERHEFHQKRKRITATGVQ